MIKILIQMIQWNMNLTNLHIKAMIYKIQIIKANQLNQPNQQITINLNFK